MRPKYINQLVLVDSSDIFLLTILLIILLILFESKAFRDISPYKDHKLEIRTVVLFDTTRLQIKRQVALIYSNLQ